MPTENIDKIMTSRFKLTFGISAFFQFVGVIVCASYLLYETRTSHLYSFYRTRVVGDTNATAWHNPADVSFIRTLEQAYAKSCPEQPSTLDRLLMLETSFDAELGLENVVQTWMPVAFRFFRLQYFNGYTMLLLVFTVATTAQIYFLMQMVDFFRKPCLQRWLEYALTSPLQVVLVAGCVMIRDAHTIIFLFAAQFVCVLLGFPMECAMQNAKVLREIDQETAVDFQSESAQSENTGLLKKLQYTSKHDMLVGQCRLYSDKVWWLCLFASGLLHVAVWFVIINQLSNVEHEARCYEASAEWKDPLRAVVYGQCVLFSLFALVPPIQKILIRNNVREVFLYGSLMYAWLSVFAKLFLGASYIAFVALFPFRTRL
jgi:hypothetical protein